MRAPSAILVAGLLVGCAGTGNSLPQPQRSELDFETIAAALAGDYVSIRSVGESVEPVNLELTAQAHASGLTLGLIQRQGSGTRLFRLDLEPVATGADRLQGRFMPLQAGGEAAGPACDMEFRLAPNRLAGETNPVECRFQSAEQTIGLLKEIVFESDRIRMADQLLLPDGSPLGDADRLTLARVAHFSGMLARRDGSAWRVARNLRLSTGGNLVEPLDAAGMSLGLLLNLELVSSPDREVPALRLQLLNEHGTQVEAETWAALDSTLVGLSLDAVRIELHREN